MPSVPGPRTNLERALMRGNCITCRSVAQPTARAGLLELDATSQSPPAEGWEWIGKSLEERALSRPSVGDACEIASQCEAVSKLAAAPLELRGEARATVLAASGARCLVGLALCAVADRDVDVACIRASALRQVRVDPQIDDAITTARNEVVAQCLLAPTPGLPWIELPRWMRTRPMFCRAAAVASTRRRILRAEKWAEWGVQPLEATRREAFEP